MTRGAALHIQSRGLLACLRRCARSPTQKQEMNMAFLASVDPEDSFPVARIWMGMSFRLFPAFFSSFFTFSFTPLSGPHTPSWSRDISRGPSTFDPKLNNFLLLSKNSENAEHTCEKILGVTSWIINQVGLKRDVY